MKFEDLYKSNELINICKKITGNHCMTDDLYQEVLLCLLEYNPSKLKEIESQGYNNIKWFAVRIAMTMWRSPRSTFNYKYNKNNTYELSDNINIANEEENINDYDTASLQNFINTEELNQGKKGKYPYDARILHHYLNEGSIRKLHKQTSIPISAIHFSLKKSKDKIKKFMTSKSYNVLILRNVPESGIEYHRCFIPSHHIAENYKHINITLINNIDEAKEEFFKDYQLLVITRQLSHYLNPKEVISKIKKAGCKVIYDIDDYWFLPNDHVLYPSFDKSSSNHIIETIKECDLVTTTTSYLADKIRIYNSNVEVLPNAINPNEDQWINKETTSPVVRVGWQGGICHLPDIELMDSSIQLLHDDDSLNNKYQIVYGGFSNGQKHVVVNNDKYEEVPTPIYHQESYKYELIFTNNYKCISAEHFNELKKYEPALINTDEKYRRIWGKDAKQYATMIDEMDVCLIPLKDNDFNRCKSPLKLAEFGFKKKPCIVSNVVPYSPIHNGSNFVAIDQNRNHRDWYKNIKRMIESKSMREDYGNALYESVKHRFHIDTVNKKRVQVWDTIVNG